MRKALLVPALTVTLVAATAATVYAATPTHHAPAVAPKMINAQFVALAATLPPCGTQVTNCRYGTAATHLEASVQSPTATIYFEIRAGVLTVLQVYPVAR